jgi:hypothetical protein
MESNLSRAADSAERTVPAAQAALESGRLPNVLAATARLRVQHPNVCVRDLAQMAGISKDTFTGRLRRVVAVGRQAMHTSADQEARRRLGWSELSARVMGGYLTLPTTGTLRAVTNPGLRIIAATNILNAIASLTDRYRGVLDDAAVEMYRARINESSRDTRKGDVIAAVAARSRFIEPAALARRVAEDRGREYRRGRYQHAA